MAWSENVGDADALTDDGDTGIEGLGEAEVQHLDGAVVADFDIRGLQIAVHDAVLVRRVERAGHLRRDGHRLRERDRPSSDTVRQRGAVDEFHHDRRNGGRLLEPVNVRDVRMIQPGERLRFALESAQAFGIVGDCLEEYLIGDVTMQPRVVRPIHLAHPAFADLGDDFVNAETRAGCEGRPKVT